MSDSALLAETKSKNVWRKRAESAEARAAALESERDQWIARLQAYDEIERANADLAKAARTLKTKLEAVTAERDAMRSKLAKIADMAERAAMVQDRSVGIIKQTCKAISDKAKE